MVRRMQSSGQIIIRFFFTIVITTSSSFKDFTHIHKSLQEEFPNIFFNLFFDFADFVF